MASLSLKPKGQGHYHTTLFPSSLSAWANTANIQALLKFMNSHPTSLSPQKRKKNNNRSPGNPPKKTMTTPKKSLAVENRQRLVSQKNPILKNPSFNYSESLFSKPQLVMQGWEHQMSPQHRLSLLQDGTAIKLQKSLQTDFPVKQLLCFMIFFVSTLFET